MRGQLAAGVGHAANDVAHRSRNLRPVQAELAQLDFQAALAHDRERRMFDAHATRAHEVQRIEIDLLVSAGLTRVSLGGGGGSVGGSVGGGGARRGGLQRNQLRRIASRQSLARI